VFIKPQHWHGYAEVQVLYETTLSRGRAALPAACNSWLQISYWNSISIEKCFSNKRSISVKSIYFEIQISLYNKEASKLKREQISQRKSEFFMQGKKNLSLQEWWEAGQKSP